MKKDKREHKWNREKGIYFALDLLPTSCNVDPNEAEWTKNKKNDSVSPTLVAFCNQARYKEFVKLSKKKNMRMAQGLMPLAQKAMGMASLPITEPYVVGTNVVECIDKLKSEILKTEAVLPVEGYRGSDSGEANQIVIVNRDAAYVFLCFNEKKMPKWLESLQDFSKLSQLEDDGESAIMAEN